MFYFYVNPHPTRADLWEMLRDPKGLAVTTLFIFALLAMCLNTDTTTAFIVFVISHLFQIVFTGILGVFTFNELGLANLRREAVAKGFNRPQLPLLGAAFNRMLAGSGIWLISSWLFTLLYLFSPLGPGVADAFGVLPIMITFVFILYGIAYSNERYTVWYGEIWPDEDDNGGGGWDDEFIPDPNPQNQLSI